MIRSSSFTTRVHEQIRRKRSTICLGLDPRPEYLPPKFLGPIDLRRPKVRDELSQAYREFSIATLECAAPHIVAVKPQSAFFEQLGAPGVAAFEDICRSARELGIIVIADVKRGDIGTTAEAYSAAFLRPLAGESDPLADACTVNPYLGRDGLLPFVEDAVSERGGVFALVKTSNPSSKDLQDLLVDGRPLYDHVIDLLNELQPCPRDDDGYGPLGAVVGATHPKLLFELRRRLSTSLLLIPGYGAQGGEASQLGAVFDSKGLGALISASRSLVFPWGKTANCPTDWKSAIASAAIEMKEAIHAVWPGA